jgi:nicotinamidase-related amidase
MNTHLPRFLLTAAVALGLSLCAGCPNDPPATPKGFALHLRARDAKTAKITETAERIDPAKTGVVIVDMWNYHWCMTAGQRAASMIPRMNRALAAARKLGMHVIWAPTDVADQYVGTPQRERALAVAEVPLPKVRSLPWHGSTAGGCMCGPGISCLPIYGWDRMHPDLVIAKGDYIVGADASGMYSLAKQLGLTHLIYMGVHTNKCVLGKGPAIENLYDAGLRCILARDLTDALTHYDPQTGFTPDIATAQAVANLEQSDVPSINLADDLRSAGLWTADSPTEPVRITPWGTEGYPYQFRDDPVTITLSTPWLENAEIHYTTDGNEPTPSSPRYQKPFALDATTTLRAAAFRDGQRVSLPSRGFFVKLPPLPAAPDVALETLAQLMPASGHNGLNWPLEAGRAPDGGHLSIREKQYEKGLSGRAPCGGRWALKPEYERFVALAGVDDLALRVRNRAMFVGKHASAVFEVFIDGRSVAKSPIIRLGQEPWPFDIKIPPGSKQLHLVITGPEGPSPYDVGDWVHAGFLLKHQVSQEK